MNPSFVLLIALLFPGSNSTPVEDRLLKHLLDPEYQSHNLMTTPAEDRHKPVELFFAVVLLKLISLDEVAEELTMQYYLEQLWYDYRLSWNESEFDVERVFIHKSKMWTPDLLLENKAKESGDNEIATQSNYVEVYSDGWCMWFPRYDYSVTQCLVDVTWFPFDEQKCNLTFESWNLRVYELNVSAVSFEDMLNSFMESSGWTPSAASISSQTNVNLYSQVILSLHLRRKPLYYVMNVVVPCAVISIIALSTFVLQPSCQERLGLTVTILLAISVYQIIVSDKLPTTSRSTPVLVMYFVFVIAFCIFTILISIIVLHIHLRSETIPLVAMPAWMENFVCKKLASCVCMQSPQSPLSEPVLLNSRTIATGEHCSNNPLYHIHPRETTPAKTNSVLDKIYDLLKTRLQNEAEQSNEDAKENKLKHDWMLAAAVIDRIFTILLTIIFVVGTLAFIIVFAVNVNIRI